MNNSDPTPYNTNPKTTPLRYPKRLIKSPAGMAITKYPIYIIAWIKAECAFVISSNSWKCLFSTSRIACANPHKKKREVINIKGTRYCSPH
jgi:hypothetical protein